MVIHIFSLFARIYARIIDFPKEKQMCYSSICAVTNYAAAISPNKLTITEVIDAMKDCEEKLIKLITKTIKNTVVSRDCGCQHILDDAII